MGNSKKKLIRMVDKIPAFPQSVHRILQLTSDVNCAPKDLVSVFDHDPILTFHLLKLVNAPYFGLSNTVSSIKQAVVFVGINTVKNLALRIAPLEVLPSETLTHKRPDLLVNAQLRHAMTTAVIARRLARRMGVTEGEVADYFVAGLLHDFGQLVFARCRPRRFQHVLKQSEKKGIPLLEMEKRVFGMDHTELGAYLGEKWLLPKGFTACMRDHHLLKSAHPSLLHDCIYTANLLASMLSSSYPYARGMKNEKLPKTLIQHFGLTLPELLQTIGDVSEEVGRTQTFF